MHESLENKFLGISSQKKNNSGFVLVGAGLPRTGTTSLRAALGILLDGACHHMQDVGRGNRRDIEFWYKAMESNLTTQEWVDKLQGGGYRSGVDYPISLFYKEIMKAFPEAKVLLSVRSPSSWYKSVHDSIYFVKQTMVDDPVCRAFLTLIGKRRNIDCAFATSNFPPNKNYKKGMLGVVEEGPDAAEVFFNQWVREVKAEVPKERLLVFEVKEGWKPLCEFLGLPQPDVSFPHLNDTSQMRRNARIGKILSYVFVVVLPMLIVIFLIGLITGLPYV